MPDIALSTMQDCYARYGFKKVAGWLDPVSALIISHLSQFQKSISVCGGVGEIGIHHGRLFILLYLSLVPGERAFAIDVFGQQSLNVDQSGAGDKEIFLSHLKRFGGDPALVDLFEDSSLHVLPEHILERTGPIRFMSIDGGHTAAITRNDLRIADQILVKGGIVAVDDYFNLGWPDVSIGTVQFLAEGNTELRPFAITKDKLFLCNSAAVAARYRDTLVTQFKAFFGKKTVMFDSEVVILGKKGWLRALKDSQLGQGMKWMKSVTDRRPFVALRRIIR